MTPTPTPWYWEFSTTSGYDSLSSGYAIYGADTQHILTIDCADYKDWDGHDSVLAQANADHILQRVNSAQPSC